MLSYNQIKTFEAGSTFRWTASIIGGPGPIDNSALNLLGGKFIPCTKVDFADIITKSKEIPITPDFSLQIPYISMPITSVEITVEDNYAGAIRQAISTWNASNKLVNGRAVDVSKFYKLLKIDIYAADHSVAYSRTLYIVPDGDINISKDDQISSDNYPIKFIVVGQD